MVSYPRDPDDVSRKNFHFQSRVTIVREKLRVRQRDEKTSSEPDGEVT